MYTASAVQLVPTMMVDVYKRQAEKIAATAAKEKVDIVVAIGGDGTINEIGRASVSYTHLDVYKRQVLRYSNGKDITVEGIVGEPECKTTINFDIILSSKLSQHWERMRCV